MEEKKDIQKKVGYNLRVYALREGFYRGAFPMINGSLIQLFLAHKGVSASQIGLFSSVVYLVTLFSTMLLSGCADSCEDIMGRYRRLTLLQTLLYLPFFLVGLGDFSSNQVFYLVTLFVCVAIVVYNGQVIVAYKLPYSIITMDKYGVFSAFSGLGVGIIGMVANYLYSEIIDANVGGNPYFICMLLSLVLLVISYVFSWFLKPIQQQVRVEKKKRVRLRDSFYILSEPIFKKFIIPNTLRGITLGITESIALLALSMGLSEGSAAKIPLMFSIAYIVSSFLYYLLPRWLSVQKVGLLGCALLSVILFLPRGNDTLFLTLVFVSYMGRLLTDAAVPDLVYRMITPEIAGAYNAWRGVLYNVCSVITTYVMGQVVEHVNPLVLLIPCVVAYIISMSWYCVLFRKIKTNW